MSMLSEPRRKAKWSINPRGNLWANGKSSSNIAVDYLYSIVILDEGKFGQKLLEKMGWERGKGLGAKEQGMIDPVTLKSKDDNKGIGFKGHDDTWIAHQDDFSAVLEQLNKEHGGEDSNQEQGETAAKKSLEHTSKSSRKRVQ
jgi:Pin2-interacting protein X1